MVALAGLALPLGVAALRAGVPAHTIAVIAALAGLGIAALRSSRRAAESRRTMSALPSVCEGLAAATRAGLPLVDALATIAAGHPPGVATALRETAALFRLSRSFDDSMHPIDRAFGSPAVLLRETLRAFHRQGGDVARALDRAATLAREELALVEETRALTAQGRTSALVLALLAPLGLVFFVLADADGAHAFLVDPRGGTLLSLALALEGIGAAWLWRLVRS